MSTNNNEQKTKRTRRILSAEKKYQVIEEIKTNPEKQAEILRREGLYRSDIIRFENTAKAGAIKALREMTPGRKKMKEVPSEEYETLKKELERKEKALADMSVDFMILKKKVTIQVFFYKKSKKII
jgi:transposase